MAACAVRALDADPGTDAILLDLRKPPDARVAAEVVGYSRRTPVVAACIGMTAPDGRLGDAVLAGTLEEGAIAVTRLRGGTGPRPDGRASRGGGAGPSGGLTDSRTAVRGFFTGGTLCYEAQVLLSELLGPVYSNIPLAANRAAACPAGAHVCLDLGEEEYTKGRPPHR